MPKESVQGVPMDDINAFYLLRADNKISTQLDIPRTPIRPINTQYIPILHWYNYHEWADAIKPVLSQAGLLKYVISPETTQMNPIYRPLFSELSALLLRYTISNSIISIFSPQQLLDGPSLWAALETELVPKGLAAFLLCSVALREGPFTDESDEQWDFRRGKLEEEVRFCGIRATADLHLVVKMMGDLGMEFDGLKRAWLEMEVHELTQDTVEWMIEGWVVTLSAGIDGGSIVSLD